MIRAPPSSTLFPYTPPLRSPPRWDQSGSVPPPAEIAHFPAPVFGNGTTYISSSPVSFELYASHRPLGERAGDISVNVVATTGTGAVSIPGRIARMSPEPGDPRSVRKISHFPSGDQPALYKFRFS